MSRSTRRLTGSGSDFKASQKTGPLFKVSSDRLGEARNRTCDPWFTRHRFIPYTLFKQSVYPCSAIIDKNYYVDEKINNYGVYLYPYCPYSTQTTNPTNYQESKNIRIHEEL